MLEASAIQLRFVPLDRLLLHEEVNPFRVKRLAKALSRDGKLRNPPVVAERGERYVVLDGATRTSVLREMGFRDALVQIVDHKADVIELRTWHHVVVGLAPNRLLANLARVDNLLLKQVEAKTGQRMLAAREIVGRVIMHDGREFAVWCEGDVICQANLLCDLVAVYRGKAEVHRTTSVDLAELIRQFPDLSAVVVFFCFSPSEIIDIALNSSYVPMGITRHIISGRALGLDIPLEMLTDEQALVAKNDWLQDLIRQRLQANKIRLYQEPVFIFDD